jgi:hypothetical protein
LRDARRRVETERQRKVNKTVTRELERLVQSELVVENRRCADGRWMMETKR